MQSRLIAGEADTKFSTATLKFETVTLTPALIQHRIVHPELISGVLKALALDTADGRWLTDLQGLDDREWVEMISEMVSQKVALGNRAKLRRMVYADPAGEIRDELKLRNQREQGWPEPEDPRRLQDEPQTKGRQEEEGFPVETAALAVTALLGLGSYILQVHCNLYPPPAHYEFNSLLSSRGIAM